MDTSNNLYNALKIPNSDIFLDVEKDMFTKEFTLKDLSISARVLQNWEEQGILMDSERKTDENHKFNFIELIWLKIILELRVIGFSLPKIKEVKERLAKKIPFAELMGWNNDEDIIEGLNRIYANRLKDKNAFRELISVPERLNNFRNFKVSILQLLIHSFLTEREDTRIIIFENGETIAYIEKYITENIELLNKELQKRAYITIPMFKLVLNFIEDEKYFDFISKAKILTDEELQILELVRSGKFETITIKFKDAEPVYIECTADMKIAKEARISELLLARNYESIHIENVNGHITYSTKTTKYKLK